MRACTSLLATAVFFGFAAPGLSHHSHAMFDYATTITVTGTVSDVSYRNPHVFLCIDAEG